MAVSLTHFAESIFVAMINGNPAAFAELTGIGPLPAVAPSSPNGPAFREVGLDKYAGRAFDGAARVDTVVALTDKLAVPFELKLGTARLTKSRVDNEWLAECRLSHGTYSTPRWSGNMMAILERNFKDVTDVHELVARVQVGSLPEPKAFVLTRDWFVVARRSVVNRWRRDPPKFSPRVKLLAFEDVVDAFGGKPAFNRLVESLLNIDFYDEWLATDSEAGEHAFGDDDRQIV